MTQQVLVAVVRVRLAWWVRWYLAGVVLMARMSGLDSDPVKVARWVGRGVRVGLVEVQRASRSVAASGGGG